jgi:Excalibur calcium-binding domain
MKIVVALAAICAALGMGLATAESGQLQTPNSTSHTCGSRYVHAVLSWGHKCLAEGQFCKVSGDREYHRYGFHCHTGGRLSRKATPNNASGAGCQPGYSPCLPRVADLNCGDIPSAKKPVRVTGSDPYRLDGDGDGVACEP